MSGQDQGAAEDRDVELVRRTIDKLSGLDMYQLAKGDGLMALDALDRINQRLEVDFAPSGVEHARDSASIAGESPTVGPAEGAGRSAARDRSKVVYVSETQRRRDLAERIRRAAFFAEENGEGSVFASERAVRYAKQIVVDAAELLASLEARYEAIKHHPGGAW